MVSHKPFRSRGSDSSGYVALITFLVIAGLILCVVGVAYNATGR